MSQVRLQPLLRRVLVRNYVVPTAIMNAKKCPGALSDKMMRNQRRFQKCDGKPIFLKAGGFDNFLYRVTVGLALLGLIGNLHLFFGYIWAPYTLPEQDDEEGEEAVA